MTIDINRLFSNKIRIVIVYRTGKVPYIMGYVYDVIRLHRRAMLVVGLLAVGLIDVSPAHEHEWVDIIDEQRP